MLNLYFSSETEVKDPSYLEPVLHTQESIIISSPDLKDVLHPLNAYKASGPNLISSNFLKEGANRLA